MVGECRSDGHSVALSGRKDQSLIAEAGVHRITWKELCNAHRFTEFMLAPDRAVNTAISTPDDGQYPAMSAINLRSREACCGSQFEGRSS
jgi:hypothetical protein